MYHRTFFLAVTALAKEHVVQNQRRIHKHWITDATWQLVKPAARLRDMHHASRLNVGECRLHIAFEAIRHDGNDRRDRYPFGFLVVASMNAFKLEATALRVLEPSKTCARSHQ